jgi:cytochrome o ubiquinol oxidase subunit IV
MSQIEESNGQDVAPGFMDSPGRTLRDGILTYSTGLALAALLTIASFYFVRTHLIWGPGIVMALVALAIAQIGVHLVFFLHLTTAPDNTNNALALAFGVLIVTLVVGGSLWIMSHLAHNVMPDRMMAKMDRDGMASETALRAEGVVASAEPARVGAGVSGVVGAVHCVVGMHVEAGRLCAEIDPRPFRAAADRMAEELRAAQTRLDGARARLGAARDALERAEGAQRGRSVIRLRRSVERRERRVDGASADVERARAALSAAEADLAATRIVAPVDGTILSRNIEPGRNVSARATTPLFVIAPDAARVAAKLAAADRAKVSIGDEVVVTVDARPAQSFHGTVTKIAPAREGGEPIVEIMARDPSHQLAPGMAAKARISPRRK